jgi:hypothetical protein
MTHTSTTLSYARSVSTCTPPRRVASEASTGVAQPGLPQLVQAAFERLSFYVGPGPKPSIAGINDYKSVESMTNKEVDFVLKQYRIRATKASASVKVFEHWSG